MSRQKRRQYLCLAGGAVTTALAGCFGDTDTGGDEDDTATPTSGDTGDEEDTPDGEDTATPTSGDTGDEEDTPDGEDTATPTNTEDSLPEVETSSERDTEITFAIESETEDFETLTVDFDRIEFVGGSDTDDVTVRIEDTDLDFADLPDDGKTYLDTEPFPSGTYLSIDIYVTVQESELSEGGTASFDYEPPVSEVEEREISDDRYQNFTYTIAARKALSGDAYELSITRRVAYGAP
ncbi:MULTISPECIES: DUF4382 domain-containing protein [Haloarcula]|uniref:DUF4382 domain-containing protein n=1 Tax=Haloarcula TaxID=2237 RepID=UPI0023E7F6C9|nr:DUF4382 domain-containing protein [Halomicroarcula sp. SHR3]